MATAQEIQAAAAQRHTDLVKFRAREKADFYVRLQEALGSREFLNNGYVYRKMVVFENQARTIRTTSLTIKIEKDPVSLGSFTVMANTGNTK